MSSCTLSEFKVQLLSLTEGEEVRVDQYRLQAVFSSFRLTWWKRRNKDVTLEELRPPAAAESTLGSDTISPQRVLFLELLTVGQSSSLAAQCGAHVCEAPDKKCDFVCDCIDCSDEENCGYRGKGFECDFEDAGLCGWKDQSFSPGYKWERQQGGGFNSGPSSDYTIGTATGHTGLGTTPLWASVVRKDSQEAIVWRPEATTVRGWKEATIFLGQPLPGECSPGWKSVGMRPLLNSGRSVTAPTTVVTGQMRRTVMVMYTHQFGPRSGGLTVLVADRKIYPVWERGGALGDVWIIMMAAIRDFSYGGIAVDSITLSPECRLSSGISPTQRQQGWTDTSIGNQAWTSVYATSKGLSCNFENDMCGWYQDNSDNYDWTMRSGWITPLASVKALLWTCGVLPCAVCRTTIISFPQLPTAADHCLSFFYKLYGPNTGSLNVKLSDKNGYEAVLWTRSGAHGNMWHEAHCPVPQQLTGFGEKVAIDDVTFVDRTCTVPRVCSLKASGVGTAALVRFTGSTAVDTASPYLGPNRPHSGDRTG
ncbi:hypothetical protein INR49_023377 [Caranx melampygus]|nr:hypothetical protein INR49_023377 [Caranx melampygus]